MRNARPSSFDLREDLQGRRPRSTPSKHTRKGDPPTNGRIPASPHPPQQAASKETPCRADARAHARVATSGFGPIRPPTPLSDKATYRMDRPRRTSGIS